MSLEDTQEPQVEVIEVILIVIYDFDNGTGLSHCFLQFVTVTGVFKTTQPPQSKFTACNLQWAAVNQTESLYFECFIQRNCLSDQF